MKPFSRFESRSDFSIINAYLLSLVSSYQYVDSLDEGLHRDNTRGFVQAYQKKFAEWGMNRHQFFYLDKGKSSQGFIMADDQRIILGFRGSETSAGIKHIAQDFLKANARAVFPLSAEEWSFKVDHKWLPDSLDPVIAPKVHRGFYKAYQEIRQQLVYSLEQVGILQGKELYITGHSLGGALAILAAYDLTKVYGYPPKAVYTFGMPRVGFQPLGWRADHDFRSFYNDPPYLNLRSRTFRMVNLQRPTKMDGIPALPPVTGMFNNISGNYEHVGTLVHLFPDKMALNDFEKVLGIPDMNLHSSITYARRLYAILEREHGLTHIPIPPEEKEEEA